MKKTTTVYCTHQFEATHCWPNAPDNVAYLRNAHRHMFHVAAHAFVSHNDRDIEFITLKHKVSKVCSAWEGSFCQSTSCEMMAEAIIDAIPELHFVQVSEDGENGAIVYREVENGI